ncbi:hypothetical protein BKH46_08265 [Helicobacter sp. 12S02634-8]|uniref:hypothetical protein n=1 Tax=Helicobacter sp. 12S02634-8 TaxID=1476199 RepID=UPI000BA4F43C|nr:hypothetical protein [Helicobacter sp. 12S02634-8]PAF46225.1 hypothetical protein BKH46_08265 [Helicobacter sp. 12S02634-8]
MVITIPNADASLIKIIESLNEKRSTPYEVLNEEEPNARLTEAIKEAKELKADLMSGKIKGFKNIEALRADLM